MTAGQIVTDPDGEKVTLGEIGQTVLLDNERIRVWEVALEPGATQPWHLHHNPYLVVCLASSPCHMDWLSGDPARHIEETVGGVVYRPPSPVHMLTNDGDRDYRNRLVELKDLGEEAVGDLSCGGLHEIAALPGLPIVFDEDKTRVYEVELEPGATLAVPPRRPPYLLVTISGADPDVSYHPAGTAPTLTNSGRDPLVGRLIELKYLKEMA
jgi:quercetin dioxygenase-like cupin family protein